MTHTPTPGAAAVPTAALDDFDWLGGVAEAVKVETESKPKWYDDTPEKDPYRCALETARKSVEKVKALRKHVEVARMARVLFGDTLDMPAISVCVPGSFSLPGVLIHVNVKGFAELTPLRRWLRSQGYKPSAAPEDYPEIGRRTFAYGDLSVLGLVPAVEDDGEKREGGPRCRRIKIGEKMEPVYKIVCDTDAVPEEEDGPPSPGAGRGEDVGGAT